jgi:nicotinic acid mononucleotide adenylyltransferase
MEELEKAAEEHADNNVFCHGCTDYELQIAKKAFILGAKWMLDKLQDFDTWKEWKDMASKEEIIVTEYRDGNIKVETFKSK